MIDLHFRRFRVAWALALLAVLSTTSRAGTLSDPQVDSYNMRIGTETFAAMYKFTANSALVETAQAITNMGSDAIKLYLGNNASGQEGVSLPSNVTNLMTLVRDCPDYHQVLDMPFRHFVMWAYPFANSDEWWGSGYNSTQGAKDYAEMYAITQYLLTNYNNSGKTFYLGHWEGDGYLEVNGWTTNPSPATISGMIGWLNNRQKAVDDAKAATTYTNVAVYNYAECNRVRDAMLNGTNNNQRVINYVVPYVTNLDYLSYSSYDSQNLSQSDLYTTLNYMQSMLPTNKASVVPGERMWIGEYGWGTKTTAAQEPMNRSYIQRLIGWNYNGMCLPFILFWEMYSNYNPGGGTNYCLIDYTDTKVPSWYLHNYFYNYGRLWTAQFKETNNRLPNDTEFTAMMTPLLNQVLPAPVSLTVANAGAVLSSNATVTLKGSLAQGIYGDSQASIWVYYGTQDGGTNFSAWQGGRFIAINTNFNPRVYSITLNNLLPDTNYYYRFYSYNANTNVWAASSAQFNTFTVNPPDYGSSLKITFAGYNGGETLSNFPVMVALSTNLPGFSYRQFASPTGGDLRFADQSGVLMIPFEIDEWNTNGTSIVWVNVPAISTSNDFIWAYWGNPNATNLPSSSSDGSTWPGYDIVWHLKQSGFPYLDSTLQHPANSGVAPALATGEIGHGESFNGSSTWLDAGTANLGNAFTLSAWVNQSTGDSSCQTIWANQQGGFGSAGFALFVDSYKTNDQKVLLDTGDGVNGSEISTGPGLVTFGHWHNVAATIDRTGGTAVFYVDGTNAGTGSVVTDFINNADINFGRFTNSALYFKGSLDEARIQSGVQDAAWMAMSYSTVASNSTLQSYSTVSQQTPSMAIASNASGPVLSWPANGVGFALWTTTNLVPPVVWSPATNQVVFTNNVWQVALPSGADAARFYRLQSQ